MVRFCPSATSCAICRSSCSVHPTPERCPNVEPAAAGATGLACQDVWELRPLLPCHFRTQDESRKPSIPADSASLTSEAVDALSAVSGSPVSGCNPKRRSRRTRPNSTNARSFPCKCISEPKAKTKAPGIRTLSPFSEADRPKTGPTAAGCTRRGGTAPRTSSQSSPAGADTGRPKPA